MATNDTLRALFIHELRDLYDADKRLVKAWLALANAATAESLVVLCRDGADYTEERIRRLDRVFDRLGGAPPPSPSHAMAGLIRQALEVAAAAIPAAAKDAAILAAIQKISHYGMAGYGIVYGYAEALREREIADLLAESLEEKKDAVVEEEGMANGEFIPGLLKAEDVSPGGPMQRPPVARRASRATAVRRMKAAGRNDSRTTGTTHGKSKISPRRAR